jgi:PAS domain S-box-containing protein
VTLWVAKLTGLVKQAGERIPSVDRLNIGPRLTLCFALIIVAMLAGNAILLWQFQQVRAQAQRLRGVDQQLIAMLQAHISLMSFYERLDALAQSENTGLLVSEAETLRGALREENRRSREALSRVPPEVQQDPTLLPTLVAIQDAVPAQLDAIIALAKLSDWEAVRLRLVKQVRPLESRSSTLVESLDRQVREERSQALSSMRQAQRRILLVVPATAGLTLLFAAFLGLSITRSITQPLGKLIEGSAALAQGDFSHRVPVQGKDEFARLGNVFNDMIVRLQELYRELDRRGSYLAEAQRISHTGSFGWDVSSGQIFWSQETFRIFEYEPTTEITIGHVVQRIHPEDRSGVQQLIERVSRERQEFSLEHRLLMPDGSIKHVQVVGHPSRGKWEQFEFVGAVTDITERKHAEEALRRSEGYLTAAQRLSRTGSFGWDVSSGEIYWSGEMFRIFEFEPTSAFTIDLILERTHPDDRETVQQAINRASSEGRDYDLEHRLEMPDGSIKHVRVVGRSMREESGNLQVVGAVTDITERKRAQEALHEAQASEYNMRLEERVAERERIARELHDTLLQSVQGLILKFHAVAKQIPSEQPARQAIEKTLDHADQVLAEGRVRVRNLRTTSGSLSDLPAAFQQVAEEGSQGHEATFKTVVEGSVRELHPMILEECFAIGREALINAFSHSGGPNIEVEIAYDPRQFRLRVRDDGRGIDPAILEQGGRDNHWGLQGMRERASRIGAHLELWSRPGAGTEIELMVPAATAYRALPHKPRSPWFRRTSGIGG